MKSDEQFYQQALDEMVQKRVVQATFAKAFALSDGDENRTRASYIRLRVSQLTEEEAAVRKKRAEDIERAKVAEEERKRRESVVAERSATPKVTARVQRFECSTELEMRLQQRFGMKIHVVDGVGKFNADVPLRKLVEESGKFSSSTIYFDKVSHQFLPLEEFLECVHNERKKTGFNEESWSQRPNHEIR